MLGFILLSIMIIPEFNCCIYSIYIYCDYSYVGFIFTKLLNVIYLAFLYMFVDFSTFLFPPFWHLLFSYTSLKIIYCSSFSDCMPTCIPYLLFPYILHILIQNFSSILFLNIQINYCHGHCHYHCSFFYTFNIR